MDASSLFVAMVLVIAAVVASMVSVELGLSVAIVELLLGTVLGNTMHLASPQWLVFLAAFGSVVLTFNAGAEIDPTQLRRTWRASLLIGGASFADDHVSDLCPIRPRVPRRPSHPRAAHSFQARRIPLPQAGSAKNRKAQRANRLTAWQPPQVAAPTRSSRARALSPSRQTRGKPFGARRPRSRSDSLFRPGASSGRDRRGVGRGATDRCCQGKAEPATT
jgi:hypothetical protein